jgi:hypothetical protein
LLLYSTQKPVNGFRVLAAPAHKPARQMAILPSIDSQALADEPIEILRRHALQQQLLSLQISEKQAGLIQILSDRLRTKLLLLKRFFEHLNASFQRCLRRPHTLGQSQQHMRRGCVPRSPLGLVCWTMSVAPSISLPLSAQILFYIIRTCGLQADSAAYYMVEKMAAITRVLFDGPPAEIAFAHVFAQCDQPTVNLLSGNFCLRGEATKEMTSGEKRLKIMRRRSARKRHRNHGSGSPAHKSLLRII